MQHSAFLVLVNITKTTPSWLGGAERTGSKFDFCPGTPWLGGIVWLPGMWRMVVAHFRSNCRSSTLSLGCPGCHVVGLRVPDRMAGLATVHTVHTHLRAELTLVELNPASSSLDDRREQIVLTVPDLLKLKIQTYYHFIFSALKNSRENKKHI